MKENKKMLKTAKEIIAKIESLNGEAILVGGSVRDMLLGKEPKDIDIATNVPIAKIERHFNCHDIGKNKDFGIIVVNQNGFNFEIANYRTETTYTNGRHPDEIKIAKTFKEDSSRRDLTINALGMDKNGNIIDFHNGQEDLKNKIIRMVGNPYERLAEDKLRLLRVIRFAVKLGFNIDPITFEAVKYYAKEINQISKERISGELFKMAELGSINFAKAVELLDESGILIEILPEVVKLKECEHNREYHPEHPDAFGHTLCCLRNSDSYDPVINIAILLHDVGKPVTKSYDENGVHYLSHDKEGIPVIENICERLKLANDQRDTITFSSLHHMKLHLLNGMRPSRVYNLIKDKNFEALMLVGKADCLSRMDIFNYNEIIEEWLDREDIIEKIKNNMKPDEYNVLRKLLDGNIIMDMLGIKPSKRLGEIINNTLEWAIDNNIKDSVRLYEYIRETYKETV